MSAEAMQGASSPILSVAFTIRVETEWSNVGVNVALANGESSVMAEDHDVRHVSPRAQRQSVYMIPAVIRVDSMRSRRRIQGWKTKMYA